MKLKLLFPCVALAVVSIIALLPTTTMAAIVKCEAQGGANPYHPTTYWYDVDPQNPFT